MSYREILEAELERAAMVLEPQQRQHLAGYLDELERWNSRMNLTGLSGVDLVRRLIISPISIGHALDLRGSLADIGSGNGSPAFPICVARPIRRAHLVEPRSRRAAFLRHMVGVLGLENVLVHRARIEEVFGVIGPVNWISLQGIRPTEDLVMAMKRVMTPESRVVWIGGTADGIPGLRIVETVRAGDAASAIVLAEDQS